ncbi:MAG: RNA polymerase sigma factor [Rhizobiaceae bacterium]
MTLAQAEMPEGGDDQSPDRVLVARAAAGDRTAFAVLVERHYDFVFRVAFRWCGDRADAEDVAQEVCVRLTRALTNFKGESRFTTWLYALTINAARDLMRREKRAANRAEAWGEHNALFGEMAEDDADEERASAVWRLVGELSDKQRDAVLLVYGEGLSHADASDVMGCAEATVSWHVHEAKKRLRQLAERAGEL